MSSYLIVTNNSFLFLKFFGEEIVRSLTLLKIILEQIRQVKVVIKCLMEDTEGAL